MKIFGILIVFGGIYLIYQKACLKKPGENKLQIRKNTPYKGTAMKRVLSRPQFKFFHMSLFSL
jgi:hypothetical protein